MTHPDDAAHLARCPDCQARAGGAALDVDLDRAWLGVAAEVWARRPGPVERLAVALLRSPGLARALLTAPSLLVSWLLASALVLAVGGWGTRQTGDPWVALLAPAVAAAGIAHAYGPGIDPAYELSRTMAVDGRQILLARGLAVFAVNALLGLAASLFAADALGLSVLTWRWLVPMTAVCALALAAATVTGSANSGLTVALGAWAIVVLIGRVETGRLAAAVTADALLPAYALVTAVCLVLAIRATAGRSSAPWPRPTT